MNILVVKMSSMGDVIHALPAITDLQGQLPGSRVDWVVEEGFAEIPAFHPAVNRVIPVAIRRWRGSWWQHRREVLAFRRNLRSTSYDLVIDAQGLVKSALVAAMARGPVAGFDSSSAREGVAAAWYQRQVPVSREEHAVLRLRKLFAGALGYDLPGTEVDYGLAGEDRQAARQVMLIHGTTWPSKLWPETYWVALGNLLQASGFEVCLPAVGKEEQERAARIASKLPGAEILPRGSLADLVSRMRCCAGVVSVDTGPGHLATALNLPLVGLYGATDPTLTGFRGPLQATLVSDNLQCSPCLKRTCQYAEPQESGRIYPPCYEPLSPQRVFDRLQALIAQSDGQTP